MVLILILMEEKGDTDTNSDIFHNEKLIQYFPVQEFRKIRHFSQKVSHFRYRYDSIEDLFSLVKEWMSQAIFSFAIREYLIKQTVSCRRIRTLTSYTKEMIQHTFQIVVSGFSSNTFFTLNCRLEFSWPLLLERVVSHKA